MQSWISSFRYSNSSTLLLNLHYGAVSHWSLRLVKYTLWYLSQSRVVPWINCWRNDIPDFRWWSWKACSRSSGWGKSKLRFWRASLPQRWLWPLGWMICNGILFCLWGSIYRQVWGCEWRYSVSAHFALLSHHHGFHWDSFWLFESMLLGINALSWLSLITWLIYS